MGMVYMCSFLKSPAAFIYSYGCAFGICKGLMYSAALQAGWSHLKERIGMVSGLITCGFGFGGFIFGIVTNMLCNPENIEVQKYMIDGKEEQLFPEEVAKNVPSMLRTLVIIWSCLLLFGACTVNTYQPSSTQLQEDQNPNLTEDSDNDYQRATPEADQNSSITEEEQNKTTLAALAEENLPLSSLITSGKFGSLYCMVVCHMIFCYYMSN